MSGELHMRKPEKLQDILELQKILDEETMKPRANGFVPKDRTTNKIVLSIIAELIELNEELEKHTHKTWKQKEFKREKVLEELTDVFFFMAQLFNYYEKENFEWTLINIDWVNINEWILLTISNLTEVDVDFEGALSNLCKIAEELVYTEKDICNEYYRKWKINFNRINGDWTNEK